LRAKRAVGMDKQQELPLIDMADHENQSQVEWRNAIVDLTLRVGLALLGRPLSSSCRRPTRACEACWINWVLGYLVSINSKN
jgi:hypothetical protein